MRVFLHFLPDSKPQKTRKTNQMNWKQWQKSTNRCLSDRMSYNELCTKRNL